MTSDTSEPADQHSTEASTDQPSGAAPPLLHLYFDDSGERNPRITVNPRWFALGGVLVAAEEVDAVKAARAKFVKGWPQLRDRPFHFTDMHTEQKGFGWLSRIGDEGRQRFWSGYKRFVTAAPVYGMACVIDRQGYIDRGYLEKFGPDGWFLCRSAFDILLERSAKVAKAQGRRLKVFFESADYATNETIRATSRT